MRRFLIVYLNEASVLAGSMRVVIEAEGYAEAAAIFSSIRYDWRGHCQRLSGTLNVPGYFQPVSADAKHHPFYVHFIGPVAENG